MKLIAKGADISKHNGNIDWNRVKKTEVNFVIIRAGFGFNTVDPMFKTYIENVIKCGLDIGIYWFSYAGSVADAKKEAEFCLKTISPYRKSINYPVFFDWENGSYNYVKRTYGITPTKKLVSDMAVEFMDTIGQAGYKVGNYNSVSYLNTFFDDRVKENYDTWVAHVRDANGNPLEKTSYKGKYVIHQYSWVGRPSGFSSKTDMDYCYKDYTGKGTATKTETIKSSKYVVPDNITFKVPTFKNVITTYPLKTYGEAKISDHFKVKEFTSKFGNKVYSDKVKIHNKLIEILEALYAKLDCSMIIVNSGYRTAEHDKAVGGNGSGYHVLGRAADIICYDKNKKIIDAKTVCVTLEEMGGIYGIGYINSRAVHVDTRPKTSQWYGDETKSGSPSITKLGYKSFRDYFKM